MLNFLLFEFIWFVGWGVVFLFPYHYLRFLLNLYKKIPVLFVFRKEIAQSIKDLENDPDLFKANNRVHIFLFRIIGFFGVVLGFVLLLFYFFM
jgi:hypothetical protein